MFINMYKTYDITSEIIYILSNLKTTGSCYWSAEGIYITDGPKTGVSPALGPAVQVIMYNIQNERNN